MNILVVNCGSSSLKAAIVEHETGAKLSETLVGRIGGDGRPRQKCANRDQRAGRRRCTARDRLA